MKLKVMDRVKLELLGEGTVIKLRPKGMVLVEYDKAWRGRTTWGTKEASLERILQEELFK